MRALIILLLAAMSAKAQDIPAEWPFAATVSTDHVYLVTKQNTTLRWTFTKGVETVESCGVYVTEEGGAPVLRATKTTITPTMQHSVVMPGTKNLSVGISCKSKPTFLDSTGKPWVLGFYTAVQWKDKAEIANATPVCFPKPIGSGTWPARRVINSGTPNVGECAGWWCATDSGLKPQGVCWYWKDVPVGRTVAWLMNLNDAGAASEWRAYTAWETTSVEESKLRDAAIQEAKPVYKVKANSTYPDRPTYPRKADGTRSTTANGRAAVGAACDCATSTGVTTGGYYCNVVGNDPRTGQPLPVLLEDGTGGAFTVCAP